jgi:citrate lyase subunit beta/citryl-CoA lyase
MALFRSLMFVPGHRPRMIERALGLGEFAPGPLDVAILDLEDGVPAPEKASARTVIADALARATKARRGPARYVRVNADTSESATDLAAVVRVGLDGVVAPKIDDASELTSLIRLLGELEAQAGLPSGLIRLIPSIESARGLLQANAIAASSERVVALLFGAEDFALDLGLPAEREGEASELLHARSAIVVAAVAADRVALDGIWPDLADADGLRRDALRGRRLGFAGKSLIHPSQIGTINEIFGPSAAEVDHARRVIRAFDDAAARGDGAVALDGKLLDPPIVERARRTLTISLAISEKEGAASVERSARG